MSIEEYLNGRLPTSQLELELIDFIKSQAKEIEELKQKLKESEELKIGQNLFEQLKETCDFIALEDDMRQIINAIKKDNFKK